jgi:ankyrin repeat protein
VVKLLLETSKAEVNSKDRIDNRTPLSWAAEKGHKAVVKLLLETGKAEVNSKGGNDNWTPALVGFREWARGCGQAASGAGQGRGRLQG